MHYTIDTIPGYNHGLIPEIKVKRIYFPNGYGINFVGGRGVNGNGTSTWEAAEFTHNIAYERDYKNSGPWVGNLSDGIHLIESESGKSKIQDYLDTKECNILINEVSSRPTRKGMDRV